MAPTPIEAYIAMAIFCLIALFVAITAYYFVDLVVMGWLRPLIRKGINRLLRLPPT